MDFYVAKIADKDCRGRAGVLKFKSRSGEGEKVLETPTLVCHSSGGSPPYLTHDLVKDVGLKALHLSYADLESTATLHNFKSCEGGDHGSLCLFPDVVSIMSPTSLLQGSLELSSATHLCVAAMTGRKTVSPQVYMDVAKTIQPDILLALHDEISYSSGANRHRKAWTRSLDWLNACSVALSAGATGCNRNNRQGDKEETEEVGEEQKSTGKVTYDVDRVVSTSCNSEPLRHPALFGVVIGGNDCQARRDCATELAAHKDLQGFVIAGIGLGQGREEMRQALEAATGVLPEGAPRGVTSVSSPLEVLEAVSAGVDLIHSALPDTLTNNGSALTMLLVDPGEPVVEEATNEKEPVRKRHRTLDLTSAGPILNLHEHCYREDKRSLVEGCTCPCCRSHSRAYIHHLLVTKEILGQVLLQVHNTHHFLQFFDAIRQSIHCGRFKAYTEWISNQFFAEQSKLLPTV